MKSYPLTAEPEDELLSVLDDFPVADAQPSASNDDLSDWSLEFGSTTPRPGAELDIENLIGGEGEIDGDLDPVQAIYAVIEAVRRRHAHDATTVQALNALERRHLPQALAMVR